jgi:hypothetical protein
VPSNKREALSSNPNCQKRPLKSLQKTIEK